jgi:hypothetical protein
MEEEPSSSQVKSIRLTPEEIRFLDEHNIKLSDLAHTTIEFEQTKKEKEVKKLSRQQKVQKAVTNGAFLIIGIAFLWTLNITNNLFAVAIVGGMGICFSLVGGWGLYSGMKQEGMLDGFIKSRKP